MPSYDAGQAKVSIVPDATGFARKLEADLRKINSEFAVRVSADTAQAQADINRFREVQQRDGMSVGVNMDLARADAQMVTFRARHGADVTVKVDADTGEARRQIASLLGSGFDGGKAFTALKWNLGAIGVGSLPAIATALTTVAGAVQQVTQAGLLLPGVLAAGAASIGTFQLGVAGVSDAYKAVEKAADGSAASIKAANEALAGLAPSARDAVLAASQLKDELKQSLQLPVQDNLFRGLAEDARKLVASDLPILQKGLTGIASGLNSNIRQLMATLGSDSSKGLLDRILGNTSDAQARLSKAIDPLVHAFGTLAAAGTDTLPRLADGFGRVADRFDEFITAADQDGRLAKWIDEGIEGIGHIGDTLLNVGKAFTAITQAAGGGGGLLTILDEGSEKLATFLNSDVGQEKLKKFFDDGRAQLEKWLPILQSLPGMFTGVFNASKAWTDAILPPLGKIAEFLGNNTELVELLTTGFLAWKTIGAFDSVIVGRLGNISNALGQKGPGKGGAGGRGLLGKIGLVAAALGALSLLDGDNPLSNPAGPSPGVADAATTAGVDILGGVVAGATVAGAPGAVVGGALGTGKAAYDRAAGDLARGKRAAEQKAQADRDAGPNRPGSPEAANAATGRNPILYPSIYNPDGTLKPTLSEGMRGQIAAGNLPGYSIGPDGAIIGPDGKPIPGLATGGPTPSGRGPGPTGGWLSEIHSGEWVLPAHARAAIGDQALWAMTKGRSFAPGGYIDPNGNPITPGMLPGPSAPIAPNPMGGGGSQILNSVLSGLGGPISNLTSMIPGIGGGQGAAGVARPGLLGLLDAGGNPNLLSAWGQQTGEWLGQFGAKTLTSFATALYSGALDAFGLGNSVLSPSNPWFRAGTQSLGALNGFSPGATQDGGLGGGTPHLGSQSIRLGDGSTIDLTTLGTSVTPAGSGAGGANVSASAAKEIPAGSGAERWRPAVRRALAKYGPKYGITNMKAWENAIVRQIDTESGGNTKAINLTDSNAAAGHPSQGLLQFIPSTFAANNITGGDYLDPFAQIAAVIPYVATKYGMDANGAPLQIGRGVGYAAGGAALGPGGSTADLIPTMLSNGEHVLTAADVDAMGGQGNVYAFRRALHRAVGGDISLAALLRQPTPPLPRVPDIQQINPPRTPAVVPSAPPQAPAPMPVQAPPQAPAPVTPPVDQQQPQQQQYRGPAAIAPAPGDLNHNLAAINTGISSGFSAAGNLAATAISTAAAAGTFGAAGAAGAGGAGSLVAGLFNEAGKIATNLVNVGSSFLVGNVTAGTAPTAYGELNLAPQNVPITAPDNRRSYVFNGVDGRNIVDDIRLKDAQDMQAQLSNF